MGPLPFLRAGRGGRAEFPEVASVDQLARGGVTAWRHGPVIAGCAAAPDPPSRILAPEPLKPRHLGCPPLRPAFHGVSVARQAGGRPRGRARGVGGRGRGLDGQSCPCRYFPHRAICRAGSQGPGVPAASRGGRPGRVIPLTTRAAGCGRIRCPVRRHRVRHLLNRSGCCRGRPPDSRPGPGGGLASSLNVGRRPPPHRPGSTGPRRTVSAGLTHLRHRTWAEQDASGDPAQAGARCSPPGRADRENRPSHHPKRAGRALALHAPGQPAVRLSGWNAKRGLAVFTGPSASWRRRPHMRAPTRAQRCDRITNSVIGSPREQIMADPSAQHSAPPLATVADIMRPPVTAVEQNDHVGRGRLRD